MNHYLKTIFENKIFVSLIILIPFLSSCSTKNTESNTQNDSSSADEFEPRELRIIDVPDCLSNSTTGIKKLNASKEDIIKFDDSSGKALLSQLSVFETGDNYIGLIDRDKLFCFSLPEGQLLGHVDAKGQGPEEYHSITGATISKDNKFYVLVSKWQSLNSEIKVYSMDNQYIQSVQLPNFFGDLYQADSVSCFLAGAISRDGGVMPIVKYHPYAKTDFDTLFIGESIEPKTTFFLTRNIYRGHPKDYFFESVDTLYTINRNNPTTLQALCYLDYKGMKFKHIPNVPLWENKDDGILLTQLSVFNHNLFARYEWKREIYYLIYDTDKNTVKYAFKLEPKSDKYGISFNIGDVEFCSWPISYWDGNLLFPVPDYVMSELFNSESNPGFLKVPITSLD